MRREKETKKHDYYQLTICRRLMLRFFNSNVRLCGYVSTAFGLHAMFLPLLCTKYVFRLEGT